MCTALTEGAPTLNRHEGKSVYFDQHDNGGTEAEKYGWRSDRLPLYDELKILLGV